MGSGPGRDRQASPLRHLVSGIIGTWGGLVVLAGLRRSHRAAGSSGLRPNPGGAGRSPPNPASFSRLADGHPHRESCRPGTGYHPRARHRVLTWCPGGRGSGTTCRSSTASRMHGCGGMGPGRSGRPRRTWGTVGART